MTVAAATDPVPTPRRRTSVALWEQQPGENDLWYSRFLRFVALGPTRSVSLVSTGKRNYYPVPAHWPMVAKRDSWRERAKAFDEAVRKDEAGMISWFVVAVVEARSKVNPDEADKMMGITYTVPVHDEDESSDSTV